MIIKRGLVWFHFKTVSQDTKFKYSNIQFRNCKKPISRSIKKMRTHTSNCKEFPRNVGRLLLSFNINQSPLPIVGDEQSRNKSMHSETLTYLIKTSVAVEDKNLTKNNFPTQSVAQPHPFSFDYEKWQNFFETPATKLDFTSTRNA